MGKSIGKLVVDAVTLDAKEEWLQALRLCQDIEMPEDVRSRDKRKETDETAESIAEQDASAVSSPIAPIDAEAEGDPIDDYGRARGDPAFGKPLGWKPGDTSEDDDSEEEDSEEEDSDDDSDEVNTKVVFLFLSDFVLTIWDLHSRRASRAALRERYWKECLTMNLYSQV